MIFEEHFNVFKGVSPANWQTIQTSSDKAEAFIRKDNAFRLISPSNMFMPITDPIADGKVDFTIKAVGFNPACGYGFHLNFRQDVLRRQAQSIRFFHPVKGENWEIIYGNYRDNLFSAKEKQTLEMPASILKDKVDVSVEFTGNCVKVTFAGKALEFTCARPGAGQVSINRLNFFDMLELSRFQITGKEEVEIKNRRQFRVTLPEEPIITPFYCDVDFSEHGSFYEAVLTISGGSYLTKPGQGNYHSMRTERMDHPYFKVITADGVVEYNLLDGFMHLANKEIAPVHVYTVMYKEPEWPFRRVIRFAKPQGDFQMAVGAKTLAYRPLIDMEMADWETVFTRDGQVLYAGSAVEKHVTASLFSSPDKKIVSRIPGNSTRYEDAVAFAKANHYFYEGEPLEFTLALRGAMLPGKAEITLANAYLKPLKVLKAVPETLQKQQGVQKVWEQTYRIRLAKLPVGVYHICVKSQDETVPLDRYFAFEVMPDSPEKPTAAQASGLPYMYSALTETRGLTTDAFDPFKPVARNVSHYVSGTVFLPWYAREVNLYDTLRLYGRKYFAWLGSRCLDKWHLAETEDIWSKADFAHFGVEIQMGTLVVLYRGRYLKDFVEFAKKTGDPFYDIPRLEKLAEDKPLDNEQFRGQEQFSLDAETFRHTVIHHWPEWLAFENRRNAQLLHDKLTELRKKNPKLKFACYGPAPIYTARYVGPEFPRYLGLSMVSPEDVGYLQYEDYPELCNYPESRGSFFLGTLSMSVPQIPIVAEMYGDGFGSGCPDGAAFFAHPPYGIGGNNYPHRTRNRVYEYTYATAFLDGNGFQYWNRFGIQCCTMRRERQRNFLQAWGNTVENRPVRPLRSAAYVFSGDSWRANQGGDAHFSAKAVEGNDVPLILEAARVRKTAGEMMPFFYEAVSNDGLCAGFQLMAENLKKLSAKDCDMLVLPPLKGVPDAQLAEIRRLYAEGVSLVCSEDPGKLEELFGVKDTGAFVKITEVRGTDGFLPGMADYTTDPCFGGRFVSDGAQVLLEGERPVLFQASNGKAHAYFFNVPPTTATSDMLWERFSYGREVISPLMLAAMREIYRRDNRVEVQASSGRVLAAETKDGIAVVHSNNCDEARTVEMVFHKRFPKNHLVSADCQYQILQDDKTTLKVRFNTQRRASVFFVIR